MYFEHDSAILNTTPIFLCQQNLRVLPTTFSYCERLQVTACKVSRAGIFFGCCITSGFCRLSKKSIESPQKLLGTFTGFFLFSIFYVL